MFGEMAAITGEKRSATMIAIEHSIIVRISKVTITQKLNSCDPFIKALVAILINNISRVNERYATTNSFAEKLLADLKATQTEKDHGHGKQSDEALRLRASPRLRRKFFTASHALIHQRYRPQMIVTFRCC